MLTRYAGDGRLAIDNKPAERALCGIAITRENFLFLASEAEGERAAILYTVLESAKLCGLDPEAYLADVIGRPHGQRPRFCLENLERAKGFEPSTPTLATCASGLRHGIRPPPISHNILK